MNRFHITLTAGDLFIGLVAVYAALVFRFGEIFHGALFSTPKQIGVFVSIMLFSSFFVEMYNNRQVITPSDLAMRIVFGLTLSFFLLSAFYYVLPSTMYGRGVLFPALLVFGALQFSWHLLCKRRDWFFNLVKNRTDNSSVLFNIRADILEGNPTKER